ncbi:MAG: phnA protein [Chloroflexota bacterium]
MAKGYDTYKQRQDDLASLGRELVRRSKASCELCGKSGTSLKIFEVPPAPDEPALEKCLHLCGLCVDQIERPKTMDSDHWRCLYEAIWSETPAVQVMALRLLRRLSHRESWAHDVMSDAYLDEETQAWADQAE